MNGYGSKARNAKKAKKRPQKTKGRKHNEKKKDTRTKEQSNKPGLQQQ